MKDHGCHPCKRCIMTFTQRGPETVHHFLLLISPGHLQISLKVPWIDFSCDVHVKGLCNIPWVITLLMHSNNHTKVQNTKTQVCLISLSFTFIKKYMPSACHRATNRYINRPTRHQRYHIWVNGIAKVLLHILVTLIADYANLPFFYEFYGFLFEWQLVKSHLTFWNTSIQIYSVYRGSFILNEIARLNPAIL